MSELAPVTTNAVEVIQYKTIAGDIERAEKMEETVKFDYADKKGNEAARSHVYGLRKIKGEIERVRKEAKAYAISLGKQIDGQANTMESRVQAMIDIHDKPIQALVAKEAERKAALQMRVDAIAAFGVNRVADIMAGTITSAELKKQLVALTAAIITADDFQEFANAATTAREIAKGSLEQQIAMAEKQEAAVAEAKRQADELAALKAKQAESDRQRAIEDAAREAESKAKTEAAEALQRAEADKLRLEREAIQREADAKMEVERAELRRLQEAESARKREEQLAKDAEIARMKAESDRLAAAAKAEADKQAAIEAERARAKAEADLVEAERVKAEEAAKAEQARKEADTANRERIIGEIRCDMDAACGDIDTTVQGADFIFERLTSAIMDGKIRNVSIKF